ncbi:hypothetical protein HK103_005473 [Boothiomyces macroporosus]|uniref:Maleylacetoacetate isomerase n=1 Tax=Boothiomyces macroporosus TaxID=261099 RepID=A0AAD5Y597_9FUNG|nr:hypothetical protein HK103_005473 [Boothiomyces macroporosus]
MTDNLKLYTYWRSSCSWRVRIALNYKDIPFDPIPKTPEYKEKNPNGVVPSLLFPDGKLVIQSSAILELVDELYPQKPLLPKDPFKRATVRSICALIGSDIQPIQNLRVLNYVGETKQEWAAHFIDLGFQALEAMLIKHGGKYCFGDEITLADAYLVPQVYNAKRWGVDMSKYPVITAINDRLVELEPFKKSDPSVQVDAQ